LTDKSLNPDDLAIPSNPSMAGFEYENVILKPEQFMVIPNHFLNATHHRLL
jgi:hypothetical protein